MKTASEIKNESAIKHNFDDCWDLLCSALPGFINDWIDEIMESFASQFRDKDKLIEKQEEYIAWFKKYYLPYPNEPLESEISALKEAKDQYGYPLTEASNKVSSDEAKEPTLREELYKAFQAGRNFQIGETHEYHGGNENEKPDFNEWYDEYLKTR